MNVIKILLIVCSAAGALWLAWQLLDMLATRLRKRPKKVPEVWPVARRAVLTTRERQVHAVMKQAFPQYEILIKLPFTRFMQLRDQQQSPAFWFELLTPLTVTFTLCDQHMQPFAALDVLSDSRASSSAIRLKKLAMAAAQIRYVQLDLQYVPSARQLRDMMLSEKEQRESLWKTSSGTAPGSLFVPSTPVAAHSQYPQPQAGPSTLQPAQAAAAKLDIELGVKRAELHSKVQAQRMSRGRPPVQIQPADIATPAERHQATIAAQPGSGEKRDLRDLRNYQQRSADIESRIIKPNQYNPATIFARDSFFGTDSRRHRSDDFTEGQVTTYTTQNRISAEHVWLHSETLSGEDKNK